MIRDPGVQPTAHSAPFLAFRTYLVVFVKMMILFVDWKLGEKTAFRKCHWFEGQISMCESNLIIYCINLWYIFIYKSWSSNSFETISSQQWTASFPRIGVRSFRWLASLDCTDCSPLGLTLGWHVKLRSGMQEVYPPKLGVTYPKKNDASQNVAVYLHFVLPFGKLT